ncbi:MULTISPECIES: SGNH/GDSL hydrolase family protein [unclassified Bifidobacterium]|uniref:SGNH/GDSL hydrolase family protein n=1 Tax=unclassified Bifidobacterium TaxID=2608897 RepID=UPI00112DF10C|nr:MULTISPECIES: SGNH/GDSL hydrolase family protein [unclassified Bifidobacterium]
MTVKMRFLKKISSFSLVLFTFLFAMCSPFTAFGAGTNRDVDIFIGDSTTDGYGLPGYKYDDYDKVQQLNTWAHQFCEADNATCANYAHGGSGFLTKYNFTEQYNRAMSEQKSSKIRRIFFVGISNDLLAGNSINDIGASLTSLFKKTVKDNPDAQIIYIPEIIPPSPANLERLNEFGASLPLLTVALKTVPGVIVPDNWQDWLKDTTDTWQSDNRHPNEKGHKLVAEAAEDWINTTDLPLNPDTETQSNNEQDSSKNSIHVYNILYYIIFVFLLIVFFVIVFFIRGRRTHRRH